MIPQGTFSMKNRFSNLSRTSVVPLICLLILASCGSSDSDNELDPVVADDPVATDPVIVVPVTVDPVAVDPVVVTDDPPEIPVQLDPPPTPSWTAAYGEGSLIPLRQTLIGNDGMALVRSRELDAIEWLTALDPITGTELWRLRDINAFCAPVITADGNVVLQLEASSAAAGDDSSHDLALVDAASGTIIDQWQPGAGVFFGCGSAIGSGYLMLTESNLVIHSLRGEHRGFRISEDDTIEPVWQNTELDSFPSYNETRVLGDTLYVIQRLERSAGDGIKVVYVRRINANTGELVATLETTLRSASRLQIAGPDHLAINGFDENADEALMLLSGAGPASGIDDLAVAWQRVFDGDSDGVTSSTSNLVLSDNAFASWSKIEAGSTVTEFALDTGVANWSFQTSSFSNNDTIVSLPAGGYVVAPFGGNFLEATTDTGDLAWRIETVPEANFPQGFAALGVDNLVVVTESPTADGWVAVGVSTNR